MTWQTFLRHKGTQKAKCAKHKRDRLTTNKSDNATQMIDYSHVNAVLHVIIKLSHS